MSRAKPASWYVQQDGRLRYWNGNAWTHHFLNPSTLDVGRYRHTDGSMRQWNGQAWERPARAGRAVALTKWIWWRSRRFWLAVGLTLALVLGTIALASPSSADVVDRTIDGDTLVINVHGTEEHVRLLNIDTPETKDPNRPVECLGPEASAFTHELVPDGTKVKLVYDAVRRDKYGRLLAAVYLEDGRSVSEELARAGLGIPIAVGANRAHLAAITSARNEAIERGVGFFDPAQECTVASQYQAALSELSSATETTPVTSVEATHKVQALGAALVTARSFATALMAPAREITWSAMPRARLREMSRLLNMNIRQASAHLRKSNSRRVALEAKEARIDARRAAEAAARKAARIAARRDARAAAQAAAAARAEARARAEAERERERAEESHDSGESGGSGSGSSPGYTGPRCYDPGGVTWRPC